MTCSPAQRTAISTGSARGAGNDTIVDSGTSGTDNVQILDFASTDASVEQLYRGSEAIVIRFTGNTADSLTVFDALSTDAKGIESYVFADGVTWTKETLRELLGNHAPTAVGDGFFSVTTGVELVIQASDILRNDFDADGDTLTIVGVDAGESRRCHHRWPGQRPLHGDQRLLRFGLDQLHDRRRP